MLTKHDERKMPKNLGHIESLARSYTDTAIKTLAGIMMEPSASARARIAAAAILLDRGWGKAKEMHDITGDGGSPMKVVSEIVHINVWPEEIAAADEEPMLIEWHERENGHNGQ